jgi:hypothetical protein
MFFCQKRPIFFTIDAMKFLMNTVHLLSSVASNYAYGNVYVQRLNFVQDRPVIILPSIKLKDVHGRNFPPHSTTVPR